MTNLYRNPPSVHSPLARYSHQVELPGPARLLVVSGQVGVRPDGRVAEGAAEQFEVALENVLLNLEAAGMSVGDLVKLTFYLTEEIEADMRAATLTRLLGAQSPCMTLVYVAGLASPSLKVEIEAWASSERPNA